MNYIDFGNRIERNPLGNMGLHLLESQEKQVCQEYEIENLRIKAAMYKAYFFCNSSLAEKLQKQSEENSDALVGEFDGFSYASWRANAVYDDFGKPLHEGDFCTFDVNAADWRFKPDNIQKSGLATLEGQVTYDEQDKCFELSIDNDYCPALYFHAIEPGTLRVRETKE